MVVGVLALSFLTLTCTPQHILEVGFRNRMYLTIVVSNGNHPHLGIKVFTRFKLFVDNADFAVVFDLATSISYYNVTVTWENAGSVAVKISNYPSRDVTKIVTEIMPTYNTLNLSGSLVDSHFSVAERITFLGSVLFKRYG